ncbi:MAG: type II toxin-antitoxin system VapC family toxin [Terracidiphilus sp.]
MSLPSAFWDSSALVPLCITQSKSSVAEAIYAKWAIVTWWATEVEIRSGLTRLKRMGSITPNQFLSGKRLAQRLVQSWLSVHESENITKDACSLLEDHPLRAADALQLAAALEACDHRPRGYAFVTADQRQADAARQIGFSVEFV